ncbi:MAG: M23 family metallopeptidase [Candidatus Paceibacterota bacterium]
MNPAPASAGFFSFMASLFTGPNSVVSNSSASTSNSQTLPLLQSATNYDLVASRGGGDITVIDDEALMSENGPSGTLADIGDSAITGQISKYTVRKGDTLSSIAKMFGVTTNTIVWANNISSKIIQEGQVLVILPISGTIHTVTKGDTLASIAKKYKGNLEEIAQFNDLGKDIILAIGDKIIVPDGESTVVVTSSSGSASSVRVTATPHDTNGPNYTGYFVRPVSGGVRTQGLHGYNAIDIGIPVSSPVVASAAGEVIISKTSGWNSGYGRYIVISHYNGAQTLYGHLSENLVVEGQTVSQGQYIGLTGNTGKSTGPHIHFEIRGAKNPF